MTNMIYKNGDLQVVDTEDTKKVSSPDYNFIFSKRNGFFARWGKTNEDNPQFSPYGPEIADIEITTACNGINGKLCPWCYKSNTPVGTYMSFDAFKLVLEKLNPNKILTQVALGVDSQCKTNPDVWKIMEYCREQGIVPNLTIAQIDDFAADKISQLAGACAVSRYAEKDVCYDSVQKLTDRGMKQVNIHCLAASETFLRCIETAQDTIVDSRLAKLNALVYLSLKQKGRGTTMNKFTDEQFNSLMDFCFDGHVRIGMDSCTGPKFLDYVKRSRMSSEEKKQMELVSEPCESMLFSIYVNVDGTVFPCSFCEKANSNWNQGFDLIQLHKDDFIKNIWNSEKIVDWRTKLLYGNRCCPIYNV